MGQIAVFVLLILAAAGCKLGEPYSRPDQPLAEYYRAEQDTGLSIATLPWWEIFGDTVLTSLIETGIRNNLDLVVAIKRIEVAELQLNITRANLFPRVDYGGDAGLSLASNSSDVASGSGTVFSAVSYQVDLWGRFRNLNEAARQEYLASEEGYRSLVLVLVSSIAQSYMLLRDLDNRLIVAERTLETWQSDLDIVKARFEAGMISEVDLKQSEIQVEQALTTIQTFRRLRVQTENAISFLLGLPPQDIPRGLALQDQLLPVDLPPGLPSELLDRRPDILASERRLEAQQARIGATEALRYPSLTLSADVGAIITNSGSIFSNLTAQVFGPLFNYKANKRKVEVERVIAEQLVATYQNSFLNALREVEDAMIAVETYQLEYEARVRQVNAATTALELSWVRYESGVTSYLEILDLQRSQFNSLLQTSEALQLKYTSLIRLYQALGGGWQSNVSGP